MAQKPNLWTDALCALYERERGGLTEAEREEIRAGEQITLEGVPPVTIRRWSRRPKGFATPTGDMTYDPSGTILLSQTGVNTDVIYAGELSPYHPGPMYPLAEPSRPAAAAGQGAAWPSSSWASAPWRAPGPGR